MFSKNFLVVFFGMMVLHASEDSVWILVSRFTDIPLYVLYLGVMAWAFLATLWARKNRNK